MNRYLPKLAQRYITTLRRYLANEQESALEEAYELGRVALAHGLGVLDMIRIYQQALSTLVRLDSPTSRQVWEAAETFFLQTLSPFEATHRGFNETNLKLRQLIETLERRNTELAKFNRALGSEIRERKKTEKALRESEVHYRELFEKARRMEDNLRRLSNRILRAQEEERKHISRELHDEVGQALTAISMNLAALKASVGQPDPPVRQQLSGAQRLLQQTMETVHGFARELRPTMLDELGLLPALRSYLQGFSTRTGLTVRFRGTVLAEALNPDQKTVLYRVAQESLTNVLKHARASRVTVAIRKANNAICMEVADNGRSFQPGPEHSNHSKKRLGLLGMEERIRLVNGRFLIKAEPGRGTTIRATIPLRVRSVLAPVTRARIENNGESKPFGLPPRRPRLQC